MVVGTAPLFSVAIAFVLLDEPVQAGLILGAVLIVLGGMLLVGERARPEHVKRVGLVLALLRDGRLRGAGQRRALARGRDGCGARARRRRRTLAAGGHASSPSTSPVHAGRSSSGTCGCFALAGAAFGLSYVALFEAYYRGRVTVVSPLVATESLWGVGLSALLLRRHELVGPRLVGGRRARRRRRDADRGR